MKHSNGQVWRRRTDMDLYFIEIMPLYISRGRSYHSVINFIPRIEFRSPTEYLYDMRNVRPDIEATKNDNLFSINYYSQVEFQRPCHYLKLLHESTEKLEKYSYSKGQVMSPQESLRVLLENTKLRNPSWAEVHNFVYFLNEQLCVLEMAQAIGKSNKYTSLFTVVFRSNNVREKAAFGQIWPKSFSARFSIFNV